QLLIYLLYALPSVRVRLCARAEFCFFTNPPASPSIQPCSHSEDLHRRRQRRTKPRTWYQHRSLSLYNAITGAAKGRPGWTQPQNPDGAQQEGSRDQRWAHSPRLRPVGEACQEIGRSPGRGKSKPHPP
ncbi:unnamed protein product, partial [Pylaiella littoralis]